MSRGIPEASLGTPLTVLKATGATEGVWGSVIAPGGNLQSGVASGICTSYKMVSWSYIDFFDVWGRDATYTSGCGVERGDCDVQA